MEAVKASFFILFSTYAISVVRSTLKTYNCAKERKVQILAYK